MPLPRRRGWGPWPGRAQLSLPRPPGAALGRAGQGSAEPWLPARARGAGILAPGLSSPSLSRPWLETGPGGSEPSSEPARLCPPGSGGGAGPAVLGERPEGKQSRAGHFVFTSVLHKDTETLLLVQQCAGTANVTLTSLC